MEQVKTRLPVKLKLSYGVGHILNDLCASMWFSYMLLYMHKVAAFSNVNAGWLILVGQIADALATPFVGFESDRTSCPKYGRRKIWHLIGVTCVAFSFPFIFSLCIGHCANAPEYALMIYYIPFIVTFQFGWASTQISHLSLIPELTTCKQGKVELNAIRYFFTILANLLVFAVCFILFEVDVGNTEQAPDTLTRCDAPKFQYLAFCVVGFGLLFMAIFHCCVKEVPIFCNPPVGYEEETRSLVSSQVSIIDQLTISGWFKTPLFYQVGWLYMMTRLIVNISQVYISYFVLDTLKMGKNSIAIVPAVVYVSGIFSSLIAKKLNAKLGLKFTFFLGLLAVVGSSFWIFQLQDLSVRYRNEIYGCAALLGIGSSTLLIDALAMISEMIGTNTETSAFVYGSMSFLDKLSNGAAIMIIQYLHPCKNDVFCCPKCQLYYRDVMSFVPGGCAVLGLIVLATLARTPISTAKEPLVRSEFENSSSAYGSMEKQTKQINAKRKKIFS